MPPKRLQKSGPLCRDPAKAEDLAQETLPRGHERRRNRLAREHREAAFTALSRLNMQSPQEAEVAKVPRGTLMSRLSHAQSARFSRE